MEEKIRRIRLRVAYDGTNYHGWQLQPGVVTIESELNRALQEMLGEEIHVIGASRTDAGVHSQGNVAVFDTVGRIPAEKVAIALNTHLPEDIRVMESDEVETTWHPRHQDCRKTYEYHIIQGKVENPLLGRYCAFTYRDIDVEAMKQATQYFVGEHDFAALCAAGSQAETTVRTIYALEVTAEEKLFGREIIIRVTGSGFLYNMVRILAGTLLDIGMGRKKTEDVPAILASLDRRQAGPTLVAKGLRLIGYEYPED